MKHRVAILIAVFALWGAAVVARLFDIQIARHEHFVRRAARQQERTIELSAVRGSLLDARGRVLAESVPGVSVYADPQAIQDPAAVARKFAGIPELRLSTADLEKRLAGRGEFAWVARQLTPEAAQSVRELEIPGIYFLEEFRRSYPKGRLASNLLGYVSIDGEGLAGAEHSLDQWARGRSGRVTILRDARRGMYLVGGEGANASVDGLDVVLTIDEVIQYVAEKALRRAVEQWSAPAGSIVVLDPSDGSILALASWPTFDPNEFARFPPSAWRLRPVQDLYEPGSTFKIVTAAAALEERIVTPSQVVDCSGGAIEIASFRIREHDGKHYGLLKFEDVMANSSNIGTIRVALSLGEARFYHWIRKFGFGEKTGVELPAEGAGILRAPEQWSRLSNAVISIGQEIAVTPLQVAAATAAVANGGVLHPSHVVRRVVDRKGNVVWERPETSGERILSDRTAAVLNEILKRVVAYGTGSDAAMAEYVVAGKTGTAQKPARGGYDPEKTVASFAGYVPADRPRLVILVVLDEPRDGGQGGKVAAPVFREVAEGALRYLDVPASVPRRELELRSKVRLAAFSQSAPGTGSARRSATDPGERFVIPDLLGMDGRRAIARATVEGFEVRASGRGVVRRQSPSPGEQVAAGRTLELILSPMELSP